MATSSAAYPAWTGWATPGGILRAVTDTVRSTAAARATGVGVEAGQKEAIINLNDVGYTVAVYPTSFRNPRNRRPGAFRPDRPRGQGNQRRRHRMSGRFPAPWRAVATPSMNVFNAHCLKSNITELRSHKVSWQIQPRHSRYLGHRRRKDSPQRIGGVDFHVRRAGVRPL